MANATEWTKRVEAWRAAGVPSDEFCEGRGFTSGSLRHWAYKLGMTRGRGGQPPARAAVVAKGPAAPEPPTIRVAQIVRRDVARREPLSLVVEAAGARLTIPSGYDASTLSVVLDALVSGPSGGGK